MFAKLFAKLKTWMAQPSSVAGFSAIFTAVGAALVGQITWSHAAVAIFGGLMSIAIPDNTAASAPASVAASSDSK